jgi:NitT/TauT family transport system ATP-binding protein
MLSVTGLGHTYGDGDRAHAALDGVTFDVAAGEFVSIVGPSGCGKSTLLRAVAGLLRPGRGEVRLHDRTVSDVPDDLSVVFQDYGRSLYPWLSVLDNVALPLRRRGLGRRERRAAAAAALEPVGLAGAAGKYPRELSGGMQQRAAIARALAYRPSLLLMDEPFGSLDAQTREDLEDLVLRLRRQHDMTVLFVTHDIDESVYVADRVLVLSAAPGRVAADLPVELPPERDQLTTRALPAFVALRTEIGRLVRS